MICRIALPLSVIAAACLFSACGQQDSPLAPGDGAITPAMASGATTDGGVWGGKHHDKDGTTSLIWNGGKHH